MELKKPRTDKAKLISAVVFVILLTTGDFFLLDSSKRNATYLSGFLLFNSVLGIGFYLIADLYIPKFLRKDEED